jgi:hypothetical protein
VPGVGDRRQEIVFIGAGMDEVCRVWQYTCAREQLVQRGCQLHPVPPTMQWECQPFPCCRGTSKGACTTRPQAKICAQLDGALLSDEELAAYDAKWSSLPDPEHKSAP